MGTLRCFELLARSLLAGPPSSDYLRVNLAVSARFACKAAGRCFVIAAMNGAKAGDLCLRWPKIQPRCRARFRRAAGANDNLAQNRSMLRT
jgi:hypothetical protein